MNNYEISEMPVLTTDKSGAIRRSVAAKVINLNSYPSLAGIKIAYDMSHNTGRQALTSPTGGNGNSIIFGDYISRGATIDVITSFTPAVLSQYNVLWLEEDWGSYLTPTEKTTLSDFVSSGKSVAIVGDEWSVDTIDPASPFKVFGFDYANQGIYYGVTTNITPDPITQGVNSVYLEAVDSLNVPPEAKVLVKDPSGTLNFLATRLYGNGKVAAVSDEMFFNYNVEQENNRVLGNNLMTFLALQQGRQILAESAALFEAGVASILQAEAEKIQAILAGLPEGTAFTEGELLTANRNLRDMIAGLMNLENAIMSKIDLQERLP